VAGTNGPNVEQCYLILSAAAVWSGSVRKHDALAVQHHDYLLELERSGVLFGAGPYEGAGGWADDDVAMTIVRAEDRAATDAIVQADPLVRAGVRTARVVPWWRNGGTMRVEIRFARREAVIDGRTYRLDPSGGLAEASDRPPADVLYPCLMRTNPDAPAEAAPVEELRRQHQDYLRDLEVDGSLVASGPLRDAVDRADHVGTGMIMLRAESPHEAEELIGNEPYTRSGVRTATVSTWVRHVGDSSVGVGFGDGLLRADAREFGLARSD